MEPKFYHPEDDDLLIWNAGREEPLAFRRKRRTLLNDRLLSAQTPAVAQQQAPQGLSQPSHTLQ
jgi:hypothetical protein